MWSSAYHSYVRQPWVQKLLRRVDRASEQREEAYRLLLMPLPWRGKPRIWLHGASLGELASLWPIVREGAGAFDFIVTAWSDSAARDLREHAHQEGVVFSGLSPMEGRWKRAIETIKPDVFVSMRYEAWPELWSSLNEVSVSLLQLAAQPRSSIRWASRLAPARVRFARCRTGGRTGGDEGVAVGGAAFGDQRGCFPRRRARGATRSRREADRRAGTR